MKRLIYILVLGVFLTMPGCRSIKRVNLEKQEFTGMDKEDIVKLLGEPDKVEELVKNTEYIFGSTANLWYQMEMGEKIVIWTYETWNGHKELYFLNDSPEVIDEFFWYKDTRKNPVY